MEIELTRDAAGTLVARRPNLWMKTETKYIFGTISPNAKRLHQSPHDGRRKTAYGLLPQAVQYRYCLKVFKEMIYNYLDDPSYVIGVFELNKSGNVHMHYLLWDPTIQTDYDMYLFQRAVSNTNAALFNRRTGSPIDWMNNICYVNDSVNERIAYMDKDYPKNVQHFPSVYVPPMPPFSELVSP